MLTNFLKKIKEVTVDGNQMIWIPKFYFNVLSSGTCLEKYDLSTSQKTDIKLMGVGSNSCYYFSDTPIDGSFVYPAFFDSKGNERDGFYISKFKASIVNGEAKSIEGETFAVVGRSIAENYSRDAVVGGHIMSYWEYYAVLMCLFFAGFRGHTLSAAKPFNGELQPDINSKFTTDSGSNTNVMQRISYMSHKNQAGARRGKTFNLPLSSSVNICDFGSGPSEFLREKIRWGTRVDHSGKVSMNYSPISPSVGYNDGYSLIVLRNQDEHNCPNFYPQSGVSSLCQIGTVSYYDQNNATQISVAGGAYRLQSVKCTTNVRPWRYDYSYFTVPEYSPFNHLGVGENQICGFRFCTYENLEQEV